MGAHSAGGTDISVSRRPQSLKSNSRQAPRAAAGSMDGRAGSSPGWKGEVGAPSPEWGVKMRNPFLEGFFQFSFSSSCL